MNASIRAQHKPAMKAVRVNGKITKVKQPQDQPYSKMGDHLGSIHFVFFQRQKYKPNLPNLVLLQRLNFISI